MVGFRNGVYQNTVQPAFLAYLAASVPNATGAGTAYILGTDALTEIYDQGGNFNTNGTFTAPITGIYNLYFTFELQSVTAAMSSSDCRLMTSNRDYEIKSLNPGVVKDSGGVFGLEGCAQADMDAADTCTYSIKISGGAGNTAAISGSAILLTFVSGWLLG